MQTETLQAFHGDASIKAMFLDRVDMHIKADNLIRGTGWDDGKGCAVGCTLEDYDHSRYPIELGIPEWLALVEDTLFEGMSLKKSRTWPLDFLTACAVGADLDKAKAPFILVVLRSTLDKFDRLTFPQVGAAVDGAIALWQRPDIGSDEWSAARSAARSAAESAESAAWSAARSVESAARSAAESAARSAAESARSAAWSAARSAESAARSVAESARSAAYDQFADALLTILSGIPTP